MRLDGIDRNFTSECNPMEPTTLVSICVYIALICVLGTRIADLQRKVSALSRIEAKLDMLLKNAGIAFDPFEDLPPGVAEALRSGQKISAIKCYREATGAGLKEAKEFIEEVQRRAGEVA
jgi:hypothetical protein